MTRDEQIYKRLCSGMGHAYEVVILPEAIIVCRQCGHVERIEAEG